MEHDTLRVQYKNAIKESKVRPFVIHSFRHTFLTRLKESGCDAWTLARIADTRISPSLSGMFTLQGTRFYSPCLDWVGTILRK